MFQLKKVAVTNPKIVFLFSGQGSQYRGMGEKLYQNNSVFARSLNQSAALIQQRLGLSLIEELYGKKDTNFDDLLITHPAIVAVEIAMLELVTSMGIKPDYVVGNSLGEFAAAVATGIWTKKQAIETAIEQVQAILQTGKTGGMLAVVNIPKARLESILQKYQLYVASINFSTHFTISGLTDDLEALQQELTTLDIPFLRLPVAFPFHSPLMASAKPTFMYYTYISPPLSKPQKGFISGFYNKAIQQLPEDYFWQVISQPTDFSQLVDEMENLGPCLYLDLGPSGTSANFVKYNLPKHSSSSIFPIMSPYKREAVELVKLQELLKIKA